jgi:pimeloyl-ACP methyl ester carboxylesterase
MKSRLFLLLFLLLAIFPSRVAAKGAAPLALTRETSALFTPSACPFNNPGGYTIDCGYLSVPEDHADPHGKQIRLAIAIARSPNPNKAPDPILYLHGGPGGEIVYLLPYLINQGALTAMLGERDVILVDQRGMGYSAPAVNCDVFRTPSEILTLSHQEITQRLETCPAQLAAHGIRWQLYTTDQNAADLATVGPALGYPKVNLFGVSYGTLLGLLILRDAPEVVRSAVLDSVLPPGISSFEQSAQWSAHSFDQIEAGCRADWACRLAYPELRQQMLATYQRLKNHPASLEIDGETVQITAQYFASHGTSAASRAEFEALPAFIRAMAEEDYSVAAPFIKAVLNAQPSEIPNLALFITMACPYQATGTSPERIRDAFAAYAEPFRESRFTVNDWWRCQIWGNVLPASPALPDNDLPVLLLAGEYDGLTPPAWAQSAAQGLSQAQVFEVPYTGHNVTGAGGEAEKCTTRLVASFYAAPTSRLDAQCLHEIPAPAFILGAGATRLPIQVVLCPLALTALWGLGRTGYAWRKNPRGVAWRAAFRQMGWMPLVSLAIVLGLVLAGEVLGTDTWLRGGVLAAVLPLLMALQATGVFAAEEEAALEITLAAPRPLAWLIVERLAAVALTYTLIALVGAACLLWKDAGQPDAPSLWVTLFAWVAPALFLSGMGLYVSTRTRLMALGSVTVLALWVVFGLFARFFLPGLSFPFPFNLIQAFLWPVHIHITLQDLGPADFWLNRLFLSSAGLTLLWLAVRAVSDSESLLLTARNRKRWFFYRNDNSARGQNPPLPPKRGNISIRQFVSGVGATGWSARIRELRRVLPTNIRQSLANPNFTSASARGDRPVAPTGIMGEGRKNGTLTPLPVRPLAITQVAGIAAYEFRMLWRQRAMRVFAATQIVIFLAMAALNIAERVFSPAVLSALPGEQRSVAYGEFLAWLLAPFVLSMVLWLYPLLISNQVPSDQRIGVAELLRVLPMGDGVYLAGKILGSVLAGASSVLLTTVISAPVWFLRVGAFYPVPALNILSLSLLLLIVTTTQGVLLGATQNSTQRALALLLAVMIVPELLQSVPLISALLPGSADFLNLPIAASLQATMIMPPLRRGFDPLAGGLAVLYGGLVLKTTIIALFVWAWRKLRMARN